MDYFDFDEAAVPPFDLDAETSSTTGESTSLPADKQHRVETVKLKLINDCEVEAVRWNDDSTIDYPMFKAKEPCSLCAQMGMDCYLAARGMLITGCTACISLYRQCSFVHPEMPQGYINTFPGIAEDEQICHGPITTQRKELNSMTDPRSRKSGARFHRDAVKILKQWLSEHADHPYPTERERDELKQLTGLKRSQISNWLANARRRGKVRSMSGPTSPILGAVDIPAQSTLNLEEGYRNLGPLDRWKCSPPENEPASMTAIARAVTNKDNVLPPGSRKQSASSLHNSRTSSQKASSEDDSTSLSLMLNHAPSVSSFETRQSSNSDLSFASSRSHNSKQSFASSTDRRRRRRAPFNHQRTVSTTKINGSAPNAQSVGKPRRSPVNRIFQCTFCTDTFPSKYDWQRHEKSLHLALERWTCCPMGPTRIDSITGQQQCVFCPTLSPSSAHLETHQFLTCHEKTLAERTFYRKDHLRQHLRLIHNVKLDPHMDTWKSTTFEVKSRCGFCPSMFTTWQARADHLAAHFRNGADMKDWSCGWGFESHVERLVENAMPPYLIDLERNSMNPFIAQRLPRTNSDSTSPNLTTPSGGTSSAATCTNTPGTGDERMEVDQYTKDSNCWNRLEEELTNFVLEQKTHGVIITDKMLQDHGRLVIYGETDPWDWTMADHETWLDAFKRQHGLCSPVVAESSPGYADTRSVPVMAPYVVKGGLKSKKVPSHSGPCGSSVGHRLSNSSMPGIQEWGCSKQGSAGSTVDGNMPITPDQLGVFDFCPAMGLGGGLELPGQGMELDFDAIDFDGLDLNEFGEMDFANDADLELPATMTTTIMDVGPQYAPAVSTSMMDLGGTSAGKTLPMQNNMYSDAPEMSLENFDQLTGYMKGFK